MIEFCAQHAPRWHPVSISGYHIREAGSTAVQELAFTLADGIALRRRRPSTRGLDVDDFAPRLSFFFNVHNDFLEEIAKLRAARRMWATLMRERFGAKNPRSLHAAHARADGGRARSPRSSRSTTSCASPIQALAGVLGGVQSLHTNSLDETLALPTRAGRDGRAPHAADHRRGERRHQHRRPARRQLRDRGADRPHRARGARLHRRASTSMGGMVRAIELGFPQKEIAEAAYVYQQQLDRGEKIDGRREPLPGARGAAAGSAARPARGRGRQVGARAAREARAQRRRGARGARGACARRPRAART